MKKRKVLKIVTWLMGLLAAMVAVAILPAKLSEKDLDDVFTEEKRK